MLENSSVLPSETVMAIVSKEPGSPLSVSAICSVRFPLSETAVGRLTSFRFAFPWNVEVIGHCALALKLFAHAPPGCCAHPPAPAFNVVSQYCTPSDISELLLN